MIETTKQKYNKKQRSHCSDIENLCKDTELAESLKVKRLKVK
jgi:hypothetical protein